MNFQSPKSIDPRNSDSRESTCQKEEYEVGNGRNGNLAKIKLLVLFALILSSILLYYSGIINFFFDKERILAFLDSLGPLAFLGFIVLQAGQVVLAPIPGEVTGLIGGYTFGPYLGVALSTVGLIVGSFLAFTLARTFGRPFVERFVDKSLMDRFDYLLHHKGLFVIFILFLTPGFPKDYLCFILGLGHLSTLEFLMVSSVGRLFGTILLTLGGGYIRYREYGKLSILVAAAMVVFALAFVFRARLEKLFQSWHDKDKGKNIKRSSENEV